MRLVKVVLYGEEHIFGIPDFIHEFGDPTPHTYRGSLKRHITIEQVLDRIQDWLMERDAMPGYQIFDSFLSLLFGLNCGFPLKDIISYFTWTLKGGYYPEIIQGGRRIDA